MQEELLSPDLDSPYLPLTANTSYIKAKKMVMLQAGEKTKPLVIVGCSVTPILLYEGQEGQETHREGKCIATWPVAESGPFQGLLGAGVA